MNKKLTIVVLALVVLAAMTYVLPGMITRAVAGSGTNVGFGGSMGGWSGATINGVVANLTRIDSVGTASGADDQWYGAPGSIHATAWPESSGIAFDQMAFNDTFKVFFNRDYYAVDIGPAGALAPTTGWGVTITSAGSFAAATGTGNGVGTSVSVTAVKQKNDFNVATGFHPASLAGFRQINSATPNPDGTTPALNKGVIGNFSGTGLHFRGDTDLSGGWLRLYLGVYGGANNTTEDYIPFAQPITASDYGNLSGGLATGTGMTVSFTAAW